MMKTINKAMFSGVTLLFCGAAMAANEPVAIPTFVALDADANGSISVEEVKASPALESVFTGADADHDMQLSESEYQDAIKMLGG